LHKHAKRQKASNSFFAHLWHFATAATAASAGCVAAANAAAAASAHAAVAAACAAEFDRGDRYAAVLHAAVKRHMLHIRQVERPMHLQMARGRGVGGNSMSQALCNCLLFQ
jgi:hypothetical protein